jgi:hypothetical protein
VKCELMKKRTRLDEGVLIDVRGYSGVSWVSLWRSVVRGTMTTEDIDKLRAELIASLEHR